MFDYLCQARPKSSPWMPADAQRAAWETHAVYGEDPKGWRSRVAPVLRKRGLEVRVIRSDEAA